MTSKKNPKIALPCFARVPHLLRPASNRSLTFVGITGSLVFPGSLDSRFIVGHVAAVEV
jgi:hypothetical protein